MYEEGLSIIIPTYNREKKLCRLLDSIFREDISLITEIVIVDNNSDYDITKTLNSYSKGKIRIVRNPFNVGMASNIMSTFGHCKTKWMWLISDDDLVLPNSILNVVNRIKQNQDVSYLKFSTEGTGKLGLERNFTANNLEELIDYYLKEKPIRRGNLVFVSNGVFNLDLLSPYLIYGYEFSYTYIPHLIPVFFGLNNNIPVIFFNEKIIEFISPENGFWSFSKVGLGLSCLSHLPLQLSDSYYKKFLNLTMCIPYQKLFIYFIKFKDKNSIRVYKYIYNNIYRYYLSNSQKGLSYLLILMLNKPRLSKYLIRKILRKEIFD